MGPWVLINARWYQSYNERLAVYQLLLAMGRLNATNLNLAAN